MKETSQQAPVERSPHPKVTVIVPTLGRRVSAARTIGSILASSYPGLRVILVDQSDVPLHPDAFVADPRFEYVHSPTIGISAARNVGVQMAEDGIIAHTDDDCEAPPDWAESIVEAFESRPEVDLAYGEVLAGKTAPGGFIPAYRVRKEVVVNRLRSKHRIEGIGACMAYRRQVWEQLGGFDEALGAGGELYSAEEVDFTARALSRGLTAMETPRFFVIHHGYRTWENQTGLLTGHLFGIGATAAKQMRRAGASYLYVMARLGLRWAFGRPVVDFGRTPARLPRLRAFAKGFREGSKRPLDEKDRLQARSPERDPTAKKNARPSLITPYEPFPNFFVIGAPKSGTSSLHRHLQAHPEIFMSPVKEPNFMALDGSDRQREFLAGNLEAEEIERAVWTLPEYVDLFRGANGEPVVGEASSWYLHSPNAAERIRYYAPQSKLVAILRDPSERAWSDYRMHRRLGSEPCKSFAEALDQIEERSGKSNWGLQYLEPGFYRQHLGSYRAELKDGRLLVLLTEDLRDDPRGTLSSIHSLLGVRANFVPPGLGKRHNAAPNEQPLAPELRRRLLEIYRDDILGLQELLGRSLSAWLKE